MPHIETVLGPIEPADLGPTLPHEHILSDFIGAELTGSHRWDRAEVFETVLPYLAALRGRGFTGFVDCTPGYLGRDVELLADLARAADLHILTSTGYYGAMDDLFVPAHAYEETADALAGRWVAEWEHGIGDSGIRPGLIKTGVDPIPVESSVGPRYGLSEIDARLVAAAARAHSATGLRVASHTAQGWAALAQIRIFEDEGVDPAGLIIVHCDDEPDVRYHTEAARSGAWIEYDHVGLMPVERHVDLVAAGLESFPGRLLLSHDAGWYHAGEPGGGEIRDYNFLCDCLIPTLRERGVTEDQMKGLTTDNPARAFAVGG